MRVWLEGDDEVAIGMRPSQDVVLHVGGEDPLEAARDYSSHHPAFMGRIEVHARTTPANRDDAKVHLWGIFEVRAPGEVAWLFAQFGSERRELSVARRGA